MRALLTGASGHLGAYLLLEARRLGLDLVAWTGRTQTRFAGFELRPVDLADAAATAEAFQQARPEIVLHAAALAAIADCQREAPRARRINVAATEQLAELAAAVGARFLYVSTDLVFDGRKGNYREADETVPLSVYAQTKLEGETAALRRPANLVVRVGWLAGPKLIGQPRFFDEVAEKLRAGEDVKLFTDEWRSPLGLPTAAAALWDLALSDVTGLLHLGGPERLSRFEMGLRVARRLGANEALVKPAKQADVPAPEPRPTDVSLDSSRWRALRPNQPWPTFAETLSELFPRTPG